LGILSRKQVFDGPRTIAIFMSKECNNCLLFVDETLIRLTTKFFRMSMVTLSGLVTPQYPQACYYNNKLEGIGG